MKPEGKRKLTQLIAAVLYNCNFRGFAEGSIYKGNSKGICVPGLNCYSCPGAVAACPLGSLQSGLLSSRYKFPWYVLGMLILFGLFLGRIVCGFLCPFGLIQELLHKIPTKKVRKGKVTRALTWLKYVILAVFVILIPLVWLTPGFCKWICPAGTLEGGILLSITNETIRSMLGFLFSWKCLLLVGFVIACIFVFRCFCRFFCPLGAIYSFFHSTALFRIRIDPSRCTGCGTCVSHCKMDVKKPGDRECIQCGACREICPTQALSFFPKAAAHKIRPSACSKDPKDD